MCFSSHKKKKHLLFKGKNHIVILAMDPAEFKA